MTDHSVVPLVSPESRTLDPGLLRLLCDQGKYAEAEMLVERFAARVDYEVALAAVSFTPKEGG